MKSYQIFLFLVLPFFSFILNGNAKGRDHVISGQVFSKSGCVQPSQLFISTKTRTKAEKKVLLYQVEVPVNGSFSFILKRGDYIFHAANKEGCKSSYEEVNIPQRKKITLNLLRLKEREK